MNINNKGMRVRPISFLVGILFLAVSNVQCQDEPTCVTEGAEDSLFVSLECSDIVDLSTVVETLTSSGKSLYQLTISESPQVVLKKEDFENTVLSHLERLIIKNSNLTTFNSEPIVGLKKLWSLSLPNNNLTTIGDDTFQGLSSLKSLELDNNHIESIDASALKSLKNLTSLDLRNNVLTTITPGLFQGTNLLTLDLGNNLLTTINEGDFSGADTLMDLELGDNNIKTIHSLAFRNLRVLNYLNLNDNKLEGLDSRLFETNSIIALDLKGNNLENLANFPLNITTLRGIRLAHNNISNIPADYFQNLPNLFVLALPNNKITTVPPELLSNNRNIMKLDLDKNQMTSINITSFEQIFGILNRNVSDLDEGVFSVLPRSYYVSNVEMSDNPWDCTTQEMTELRTWTEQHDLSFNKIFACRDKQVVLENY